MTQAPHWLQVSPDGYPKWAVPIDANRITLISIGVERSVLTVSRVGFLMVVDAQR